MKGKQKGPVNGPNAENAQIVCLELAGVGLTGGISLGCALSLLFTFKPNPQPVLFNTDVLLHCLDDGPHLLRNSDVSLLLRNILSLCDPKMARGF